MQDDTVSAALSPMQGNGPLVDPELLRSFVAIVETGSFAEAAKMIGRSASAISMQVKRLEDLLGHPVLVRDARAVRLTAQGETLLGFARQLLELNRQAVSSLRQPELAGRLCLGLPDDYGDTILPTVLKQFGDSHPTVVVDVVMRQSVELLALFDDGKLDVALFSCDERSGGEQRGRIMLSEPLVWIGAIGGTAHLRDPLPISMWEHGCVWRRRAEEALATCDRSWRIAYLCAHMSGQRAAVKAGLAVAPVSRSFAGEGIRFLGEADGLPPLGDYAIGLLERDEPTAQAAVMAEHLENFFRGLRQAKAAPSAGNATEHPAPVAA